MLIFNRTPISTNKKFVKLFFNVDFTYNHRKQQCQETHSCKQDTKTCKNAVKNDQLPVVQKSIQVENSVYFVY